MPHLRPLSLEEITDPELQQRLDDYQRIRKFIPNSVKTMARRPNIAKRFADLNKVILYEGTVSEELKMLISLASSYAAGCRYCQSHMANLASIYKASDEKIAALWEFERSSLFNQAERAAISLALKAGTLPNEASKEDFDELAKYFDEGQIVEIVASIALFGYLNRWNDTMATELEAYPKEVAQRAIGKTDWNPGKHG
ncbi:MAG: carboxymuconolactone decarboxylase family protein [Sulfuritalea sp.]|nr:carboxymuconolactone decarboxylase family protein [Sulfuritalea sp.]